MTGDVRLREVTDDDLPVFFEHQRDPAANRMVAFTVRDPEDRDAFMAHWTGIRGDDTVAIRTVLSDGRVAGYVASFVRLGKPEVCYWLGREYWGRGVATEALSQFLGRLTTRPLSAAVAGDNFASIRVLEKCGFTICNRHKAFAKARGEEVEEVTLELRAAVTLDRVADLTDVDREAVRALSLAVYPPGHFDDWPGRHVAWSAPEGCVRVRDETGALASYVGVYVRDAEYDGRPVRVGGVGNVKTHPAARRRGLAALGIRRAVGFFRGQPGVEFALLVCEPRLLGYYARLGWREFGGRLLVRQHGAPAEFTLNRVMTYAVRSEGPAAGTIDLCGPPW